MNVNIVIDGIKDEKMFEVIVRELGQSIKRNPLLEKIGICWKRDGRTSSPLKGLDISEYMDKEI